MLSGWPYMALFLLDPLRAEEVIITFRLAHADFHAFKGLGATRAGIKRLLSRYAFTCFSAAAVEHAVRARV